MTPGRSSHGRGWAVIEASRRTAGAPRTMLWIVLTVVAAAGVMPRTPAGAQTFEVFHVFSAEPGEGNDGYSPLGGLVQGSDGFLYGTTSFGGANDLGEVFRMDLSGSLTRLHSFVG